VAKKDGHRRSAPPAQQLSVPPLDRDSVVRAALGLLDEAGLDAFTMRALAQRLGTYPATVYWHVGNRNDVLSAVLEVVFDEIDLPDPAEAHWDDWLARLARDYRAVMHQHPDLGAWVASHFYGRVTAPRMTETILSVLEHAGFRGPRLACAFNTFVGSLIGWVATELIRVDGDLGDDWEQHYEQQVRSLSGDDYPTIAGNIDELADEVFSLRWHGGADRPLDASFAFALEVWLVGLRALLDAAPS
jgi:TetR/AcrR family transcriptional regulator, tetracycline repressor protein